MFSGRPLPYAARQAPSMVDGLGLDHRQIESHRPILATDLPDADVVVATWWETAEWIEKFPASKGRKFHFVRAAANTSPVSMSSA